MSDHRRSVRTATAIATMLAALAAGSAGAQSTPPATSSFTLRVHVADSAGVPVADADVAVMRGLTQTLAQGHTDQRGDQTLVIPHGRGDDELVIRKIGFQRASRFFPDTTPPSVITVVVARVAHALDTVKVAAKEDDVRKKSYFIDAEDIEHSPRIVVDALDIVMKLRPDMIWGRAGEPDRIDQHVSGLGVPVQRRTSRVIAQAAKYGYCAPVQNIWVNGSRIRGVAPDPVSTLKRVGNGLYISPSIAAVLGSIKPEHIAEIQYHPCTDSEGDSPARSNNAIMVTLKEGIAFNPGGGSYVATSVAGKSLGPAFNGRRAHTRRVRRAVGRPAPRCRCRRRVVRNQGAHDEHRHRHPRVPAGG